MKSCIFFIVLAILASNSYGQKESFDVVTYTAVKGWKKELSDKSVSFSKTDEAKGTFCIISIYQSIDGVIDSKINFDNSWQRIVKETLGAGSPKTEALKTTETGWEIQSGAAQFTKDGLTGIAMLITASSNNKVVNMLVLLNSDVYSDQLNNFIASVNLKKQASTNTNETAITKGNSNASIVGIWASNLLETSGYANGYAQYSGGYFRKEYTFKSDGTYTHFHKTWSVYSKPIRYVYETGTWSANGNTLTISPTSGKAEEWSKAASNRTNEWGSLIKSQPAKLEKVSYSFEIEYYEGSQSTALRLTSRKATERDGRSNNGNEPQTYSYSARKEALIDFPPGFKMVAAKPTKHQQEN